VQGSRVLLSSYHPPLVTGPGVQAPFLVVGSGFGGSVLRILSLPDRRLVHTLTLEGMQIVGLAADPSGTAIAVCDAAMAGPCTFCRGPWWACPSQCHYHLQLPVICWSEYLAPGQHAFAYTLPVSQSWREGWCKVVLVVAEF